ncbi:hypothetical protein NQ314_021175 [Rhamnusium bicolor]|uniref:Uncharacterized protein n=1 Tax=Rhamnusium bicolor TaxID=1586634 RepID=A0AAV8WJF6_9CUCU|nr:hypothetical protein NQ314_021175 [Rhamnusium bicolor]
MYVTYNDNLPKLSCSKCMFNLYFVENIRKQIIKSDEKLRSIFNRDGNFNELLKVTNAINATLSICEEENYNNIEIKEEKLNLNLEPEILTVTESTEQCVNNQSKLNNDISTQDSVGINLSDASGDENNIKSIISKKK